MGSVRSKALVLFMLKYQVSKKNIDTEQIHNFKTFKLFRGKDKNSENTVFIVDDTGFKINKSQKDLTNWLRDFDTDHSHFFITQEMKELYKKDSFETKDEILAMRKELIMKEEKKFVEAFDKISYTPLKSKENIKK